MRSTEWLGRCLSPVPGLETHLCLPKHQQVMELSPGTRDVTTDCPCPRKPHPRPALTSGNPNKDPIKPSLTHVGVGLGFALPGCT